jgi:ketosteroid isomerase-like protein
VPGTEALVVQIRDVVSRLSAAWQSRRYEELVGYLDDDVVIVAPGFLGRVEGRKACIESYREFMERVTIERYEEAVPVIDVWEGVAVATYRWEMAWTSGGVPNRDAGHDILVLHRRPPGSAGGAWRVVWRAITSEGGAK